MGDWLQDRCNEIQKAQQEHIQKSFGSEDIQKARSGVYKPTKQNLKEGKAGQKYGEDYTKYKELKDKQNKIVDDLSSKLNSFPKDKSGIVPDNIRSSSEFKEAKKQFDTEFKKLQDINSSGVKLYKKEMDEERKNKRANLSNKS